MPSSSLTHYSGTDLAPHPDAAEAYQRGIAAGHPLYYSSLQLLSHIHVAPEALTLEQVVCDSPSVIGNGYGDPAEAGACRLDARNLVENLIRYGIVMQDDQGLLSLTTDTPAAG